MTEYSDATMIYDELKLEIVQWLIEHKKEHQLTIACHEHFRPYIYDAEGNYLIGGKNISNFISNMEKVLESKCEVEIIIWNITWQILNCNI